jgi:hypothetical protein
MPKNRAPEREPLPSVIALCPDVTHLSALLSAVKRVESVFDAYRVVPS